MKVSEAADRLKLFSLKRLRTFMLLLSALEPISQPQADPEMQRWQDLTRDELLQEAILDRMELPTTLQMDDDGRTVRLCCTLLNVLLKNAYNTVLSETICPSLATYAESHYL